MSSGARKLMVKAGYGDGFEVTLHCPDDQIYQRWSDLSGHGREDGANRNRREARGAGVALPLIVKRGSDFYMLIRGVPTFDSEYIFNSLVHSTTDRYGS